MTYNDVARLVGTTGLSPQEDYFPYGQFRGIRHIKCAWADRYTLLNDLADGGGQLYPYYTATGARACGARVVGFGKSGVDANGLITYTSALISVFYMTEGPSYASTKFLSEEIVSSNDIRRVSHSKLRWGSATGSQVAAQDAPLKRIPMLLYRLTFYRVLVPPGGVIAYQGYTNQYTFPSYTLGVAFPAETLLYDGTRENSSIQTGTLPAYTLGYDWLCRPAGWNVEWNPEAQAWQPIYIADGGRYYNHPLVDFNLLVPP